MTKDQGPTRRSSLGYWALVIGHLLAVIVLCGALGETAPAAQETIDLVVVPASQPWLLAVAAPLAKKLAESGHMPLVLAASARAKPEVCALVTRAGMRTALVLAPGREKGDSPHLCEAPFGPFRQMGTVPFFLPPCVQGLTRVSPDLLRRGGHPLEQSLRIAKRFWGTSPEAVLAQLADPESVILGSVLAAQRTVPLLVAGSDENQQAAAGALGELQVQRVLLPSSQPALLPSWIARLGPKTEILDEAEVQRRIITELRRVPCPRSSWACDRHGHEDVAMPPVRNIVVVRVPEGKTTGQTAWLAPYVSAVRSAPVVLCRSPGAADTEAKVRALVDRNHLRPHTLTILADYRSIGTSAVAIDPGDDLSGPEGEVGVEPCMPKSLAETAPFGVGRIPLTSLEDASVFFARGLARERLLAGQRTLLVMVANPVLDGHPLPLCEGISRITAAEFKNFGAHADEFYNRPANSPEIVAAARTANLIFYEGHIEHQELFKPQRRATPLAEQPTALDGLPVVFLQSCVSLKQGVLRQVHESGGVALVGTATPVHSTSGSAMVKAVADGLLYRDETLGEALATARNYFACLQDLKDLRGHTQQAKSQRVAMSFRLWGDPELRVFPDGPGTPQTRPVSARWVSPGKLAITLPDKRLPEARSGQYIVDMFPGSEAAGMVRGAGGDEKRRKGEGEKRKSADAAGSFSPAPLLPFSPSPPSPARRLTPLYFFKMPLPEGFDGPSYGTMEDSRGNRSRAVFRADPMGRFLYVLDYPAAEKQNRTFTLRLATGR
jgi:hypothetical protein